MPWSKILSIPLPALQPVTAELLSLSPSWKEFSNSYKAPLTVLRHHKHLLPACSDRGFLSGNVCMQKQQCPGCDDEAKTAPTPSPGHTPLCGDEGTEKMGDTGETAVSAPHPRGRVLPPAPRGAGYSQLWSRKGPASEPSWWWGQQPRAWLELIWGPPRQGARPRPQLRQPPGCPWTIRRGDALEVGSQVQPGRNTAWTLNL